jgi:hypothetical protein
MAQAEMKLNSAFNCLVNSLYKGEIK